MTDIFQLYLDSRNETDTPTTSKLTPANVLTGHKNLDWMINRAWPGTRISYKWETDGQEIPVLYFEGKLPGWTNKALIRDFDMKLNRDGAHAQWASNGFRYTLGITRGKTILEIEAL